MKIILALTLIGFATSASGKPVYLTCKLSTEDWSISLNENAGTLTYTRAWDGKSATETVAASYGPDFVTWGTQGMLTTEHKIDRSTLKFTRTYTVVNNPPMSQQGTCKLAAAKKRVI